MQIKTSVGGSVAFGLLFAVIGLGLLYWSYGSYSSTRAIVSHGQTANGKVVEMKRSSGSKGRYTYAPIITFKNGNDDVTFTHSVSSSNSSYSVGQSVEVMYDAQHPANARINTFFGIWGGTLLTFFIGLVFSLVGGFVALKAYRKPTPPPVIQPLPTNTPVV